jgi:hypothetical protein
VNLGGDDIEKYYGSSSMLTSMRDATSGPDFPSKDQVNEVRQALLNSTKGASNGSDKINVSFLFRL